MSTRNILGGKGRPARNADNPTAICESMWEPHHLTTLWASMVCTGIALLFFIFYWFTMSGTSLVFALDSGRSEELH
jgi:hypothetical protein